MSSTQDTASRDRSNRHRLDKWLWCARFYKSRALATGAVSGGKVKVNGERVKPAHDIRVGDRLTISIAEVTTDLEVLSLPERRGPASVATTSYAETTASIERRARYQEQHRLADMSRPRPYSRPDKRERRQLEKLRRSD